MHVCSLGQVNILAKDVLQSWEMVEKDAAALAPRRGPSLLPWPPPDGRFPPYRWGTCSQGCAPIEAADRVVGHSVDHVQPFSQKSRTPTVAKEFQIGLCGVVEADLELFCNCWSAGFLGERL